MLSYFRLITSRIAYVTGYLQGVIISRIKRNGAIVCCFPFCSVGGAEKVHLDILKAIADLKPIIFIRYKVNPWVPNRDKEISPKEDIAWLLLFKKYGKVTFLSDYLESQALSYIKTAWIKGKIIGVLNAKKKSILFLWNDPFMKSILSLLKPEVKVIDIVHSHRPLKQDDAFYLNMDIASRINKRVVVNEFLIDIFKDLYKKHGFPDDMLNRVKIINGYTDIPSSYSKIFNGKLNVLVVSRPVAEKRLHLAGRIARKCFEDGMNLSFCFIGNIESQISPEDKKYCKFLGEVTDRGIMNSYYKEAHFLLSVSESEGFPMVIMEAMAYGVIPVVTNVGGIPYHVKNEITGFLIDAFPPERCIEQMVQVIKKLIEQTEILQTISQNCFHYAKINFNENIFEKKYKELFFN